MKELTAVWAITNGVVGVNRHDNFSPIEIQPFTKCYMDMEDAIKHRDKGNVQIMVNESTTSLKFDLVDFTPLEDTSEPEKAPEPEKPSESEKSSEPEKKSKPRTRAQLKRAVKK